MQLFKLVRLQEDDAFSVASDGRYVVAVLRVEKEAYSSDFGVITKPLPRIAGTQTCCLSFDTLAFLHRSSQIHSSFTRDISQ